MTRLFSIALIMIMFFIALPSWTQEGNQQSALQQAADYYVNNIRRRPNDLELHRELMDMFGKRNLSTIPITIYRNSLESNSNSHVVLYLLGYAYMTSYGMPLMDGEPEPLKQAEENLKAALEKRPGFPDALSALGDVYLRAGKIDSALAKWQEALEANERFEPAHLSLARYYHSQREYDRAIEEYQRAISLNPKLVAIRYMELGLVYMDMNDLDNAEEAFNKAKKYDSKMAMAYYKLGQIYAKRGKPTKAVKLYRDGRKHDPNNAEVAYDLAHIFLETNHTKYALLSMERGLVADAVDPEIDKELVARIEQGTIAAADYMAQLSDFEYSGNFELHYFLGKLFLKIGENEDRALKHFKMAAGLEQDNADVHYQLALLQEKLEPEKAKEQYQKAAELGVADTTGTVESAEARANVLFKAAQGYLEEGLEAKFIETAQAGLAIFPNRADIHLQLAEIFKKRADIYKNNDQAREEEEALKQTVKHYEQVVTLQPDAQKWYELGLLYERQNKIKAVRAYDKAVQLDPDFAAAYYQRGDFRLNYKVGRVSVRMYEPQMAIDDLKKAIELDPKLADAHFSLGTAYHQMDMAEQATIEFEKTVEIDPSNVKAHIYLAQDYAAAGENKKVIKHLSMAAELDDTNAEVLRSLGAMQLKYGGDSGIKAAQEALAKAVKLKSDDAEILMNYGYTLYLDRLFNEAIDNFTKAIEIQANYPEAHYNLALAYKAARKYDLAKQHWQKVMSLVPGTPMADKSREFLNRMEKSGTP